MSRVYINLKNKPLLYESKVERLTAGICNEILPLSIIKNRKITKGIYHTDGYKKVSDVGILSAMQVLSVIEGVIAMSEKLKNNFFFPEEYILSPDTVYIDAKFENYKLAYIPAKERCRAEKSLSGFIGCMRKFTTPDGMLYLDTLRNLVESGSLKSERMIGFIERLKGEIRVCGIK